MANFSSLEILDVSLNYFFGSISPCIGALSFLKAISLYFVGLSGTFPIQGKESTMKSNFDNLLVLLVNVLKLNKSVKTRESEWLI